jgi:phage-related protein
MKAVNVIKSYFISLMDIIASILHNVTNLVISLSQITLR